MRPASRTRSAGFTLIELVMVMVITAALAVVALPKFPDVGNWQVMAYADNVASALQSARRVALAQRRPVVATLTATGITVAYVAGGSIASLACPAAYSPCMLESGTRSITFNASNSGASVSSTGGTLTMTFTLGSVTARVLQIETETGLVRVLS